MGHLLDPEVVPDSVLVWDEKGELPIIKQFKKVKTENKNLQAEHVKLEGIKDENVLEEEVAETITITKSFHVLLDYIKFTPAVVLLAEAEEDFNNNPVSCYLPPQFPSPLIKHPEEYRSFGKFLGITSVMGERDLSLKNTGVATVQVQGVAAREEKRFIHFDLDQSLAIHHDEIGITLEREKTKKENKDQNLQIQQNSVVDEARRRYAGDKYDLAFAPFIVNRAPHNHLEYVVNKVKNKGFFSYYHFLRPEMIKNKDFQEGNYEIYLEFILFCQVSDLFVEFLFGKTLILLDYPILEKNTVQEYFKELFRWSKEVCIQKMLRVKDAREFLENKGNTEKVIHKLVNNIGKFKKRTNQESFVTKCPINLADLLHLEIDELHKQLRRNSISILDVAILPPKFSSSRHDLPAFKT